MSPVIITSHYFSKSMILYCEFVAKNETNAKMEIAQNLQNPATIYMEVIFSKKLSQRMHY